MLTAQALLERGYFPKELPPSFTTAGFGARVVAGAATVRHLFRKDARPTRLCLHTISRFGTFRRVLGIPHPISHYRLCETVADNWAALAAHIARSTLSKSQPQPLPAPGRAVGAIDRASASDRIADRARTRFLVLADINRFYGSIYTHSIPWALHTKAVAKMKRSPGQLPGNMLDKQIRDAQDGQTIGVPVGPDTSLIVAECVLSAVDVALATATPSLRGSRYSDDYELTFTTREEAERCVERLQKELGHYELAINLTKTSIRELPLPVEDRWLQMLRRFRIRGTKSGEHGDLVAYFDLLHRLATERPNAPVRAYAIGRIKRGPKHTSNWPLMQNLLCQAIVAEPALCREALGVIVRAEDDRSWSVDKPPLEEVLNGLVIRRALLGNGNEVAWALWAIIRFGLKVSADAANVLKSVDDSFVALLALDAKSRGLVPGGLDTTLWNSYMTLDDLYGEQWLLSYEARLKGWLPSATGRDHVGADPVFGWLKSAGVEFYNSGRVPLAPIGAPRSSGRLTRSMAI